MAIDKHRTSPLTPQREVLLSIVHGRPGIPMTELAREADVPWNTITYHLGRLLKAGLVRIEPDPFDGRRKRVFPAATTKNGPAPAVDTPVLRDSMLAVARAIAENPGWSLARHVDESPLPFQVLYYNVRRLAEMGLVEYRSEGRNRYADLRATPMLVKALRSERPDTSSRASSR